MSQNEDKTYISVKRNKIELFENGINTARIERNWVKYPWSIDNFFLYALEENFIIGNEEFYYDDYEESTTPFWYYFFGETRKHSIVDKNNNVLCRTETLEQRQDILPYIFWGSFTTVSRIYLKSGRSCDISGGEQSIVQFKVPYIFLPVKNKIYKFLNADKINSDPSLSKKEITQLRLFGFYDQWAYRRKVGVIIYLVLILSVVSVYIFSHINLL
jgi:hypothetical protein